MLGRPVKPGDDTRMFDSISNSQYRHCEPTGRANTRPMKGSAKQSRAAQEVWIASSLRSSQ
jgi:hypothetical protein